jgi:hypothetical protein
VLHHLIQVTDDFFTDPFEILAQGVHVATATVLVSMASEWGVLRTNDGRDGEVSIRTSRVMLVQQLRIAWCISTKERAHHKEASPSQVGSGTHLENPMIRTAGARVKPPDLANNAARYELVANFIRSLCCAGEPARPFGGCQAPRPYPLPWYRSATPILPHGRFEH